ncbi:phenylalanine--tRNA ligase subunit beta [Saccharobesus litoralis]|uniref:Phenylalanine--tRNA ligase beta subunit n=1 Tax=Saccharobesus litoralis TaxID=2172099 RepID=A0A2S0VTC7_9ALTE|nr:phenylalanine--tRNA ligase subunit beta [Saccharobesus litoralis]AWB67464.1 phenylalanine--tRNA ligase subunit beta [Saccharobesus litoralis]
MKFSEAWLREWVNPAITSEELVEQITMSGLEVDDVADVAKPFSGVVVGEVVECGPHPDADKLQVTKINVGEDELLDIVCGAKNCRLGLKVAVAKVGAVLPGDFKIKKAKLRGVPSFGMLCSEAELGMADEAPGIMELPLDAELGSDIRQFLKLDDKAIEVDLTPNRSDCLGIRGLAREVGVLNRLDVTEPQINAVAPSIDAKVAVSLLDADSCPRYLGRVIKNVNVKAATPLWMVEKLRRSGIRSIDPVVDVTNYVLLELGQPMHAFDLSKIDGGIQVRKAQAGEKLTLLDGNEVTLKDNTLVIADDSKPLAMAGIFGGQDSGVTSETTDILLESAFFAPDAIKGIARQYGLHTDSSHRFERGVDYTLQAKAIERATQLLLDIVGGEAADVVEAVSEQNLPVAPVVTLRQARLNRVLGVELAVDEVTEILERLGLAVEAKDDAWQVTVPSYRFDISIEVDLIEEVARVYGYNNIPNVAPQAKLTMAKHKEAKISLDKLRRVLVTRGYQEAITYSFVDPKIQTALYPNQEFLTLPNPISADMSAMRLGTWPGLLSSVVYNQNRQQPRVRLFESGLKFVPNKEAENGVEQVPVIGGVITGTRSGEHWTLETTGVDFYDVKADVEALLALTSDLASFEFKAETHSALHPGQSAAIYRHGKRIGFVGAIHPQANKPIGLKGKAFLFEIELATLLDSRIPQATAVSKFPANRRDLAFIVKNEVKSGEVLELIKKVGGTDLVDLNLFDVYQGQGVDDGDKSLAVALTIQNVERTLEDKDITALVDAVVDSVQQQFDAKLRD